MRLERAKIPGAGGSSSGVTGSECGAAPPGRGGRGSIETPGPWDAPGSLSGAAPRSLQVREMEGLMEGTGITGITGTREPG